MRIVVLAGGIGGARFLLGVRSLAAQVGAEVTAVVNVGDDVTMHGLRICPDLDSVMYTLGGGSDTERGWGRAGETWTVKAELAAYGAEPTWFGLGDKDVATHLVRTRMLDAGYPLSAVTEALCHRWQLGIRLLPATDERLETHVVTEGRAIHFQEWWIRYRAQVPTERFVFVGADAAKPAPGVLEALAAADLVLVAPSNPVVSITPILAVAALEGRARGRAGAGGRRLPGDRRGAGARDGRRLPRGHRGAVHGGRGRCALRRALGRRPARRLAGGDRGRGYVGGRGDRGRRAAVDDRRINNRCDGTSGSGCRGCGVVTGPVAGKATVAGLEVLPVNGIGDVRPGDDLAALIAGAAPWLVDGDVLVVTSKIVSKAEGRLVPVATSGPQREADRAAALAGETARVVATRGSTRIVQTKHGFVLASAGIDASNVDRAQLVLLPVDPDASARALRTELRERYALDVAVIVSDTMGRPWRNGLTDVALGAAGIGALRDYRGAVDAYGNELHLTQMAVVDELCAAAELVKGKYDQVPVAVVRGLAATGAPDGPGAAVLVRSSSADLFSLGTAEAVALGRRLSARIEDAPAFVPHAPVPLAELLEFVGSASLRPVPASAEAPGAELVAVVAEPGPVAAAEAGVAGYRLRVAASVQGLVSAALPVPPELALELAPGQVVVALLAIGHPAAEA